MSDADPQNQPTNKRERSPSFPYIDLRVCIEHLEELYEAAKMNEVRVADVAQAWGMTAKSGSLMRYVAAMGQFGLVDTNGSGDNRRIKVSADGRRILEDTRPGIREKLCSDAALKPKLVNGLFLGSESMPHWGRNRPNDGIAESSLRFDLSFTADAAKRFLAVYDATIPYIIEDGQSVEGELAAPEENGAVDLREVAQTPEVSIGDYIQWESMGVLQFPQPQRVRWVSEDGTHVAVEGSDTGIPVEQVSIKLPPATPSPPSQTERSAVLVPPAENPSKEALGNLPAGEKPQDLTLVDKPIVFDMETVSGRYSFSNAKDLSDFIAKLEKIKDLLPSKE